MKPIANVYPIREDINCHRKFLLHKDIHKVLENSRIQVYKHDKVVVNHVPC